MVHLLHTTSSSASESMEAAASQMQSTMNVCAWFAKAEGKVGVDSTFASNEKNSSIAVSSDQSSVLFMAEASRTTGQASEMQGKKIESSLSALATIDGEKNKVLDVNSMVTALEDHLAKTTQGTSGIPINYYLKNIDQKMLAQIWAAKRVLHKPELRKLGHWEIRDQLPHDEDVSTSSRQFGAGVLRFKPEDLEMMKENGFQSSKYFSMKEEKLLENYVKEQMLMLAHDFPFNVYSNEYYLLADVKSRIFSLDNMECSVPFFLFRRPFCYRAEAIVDDLVFKELYTKAKAAPEVLRSNLQFS
ncbi:hypothetical protein FANTH_2367 [Fusarium anthophilum]|uniref:Uncharacterized protein n=1 Tax=Fusarium anthophilum TaxID=48485 RepID=A0A8H4ZUL9_9HYPO|nr:hypothetical protein FANTH_2367 [Fusarium anthophilum]